CNVKDLFSPSVRGRAAEGGRGSLTRHPEFEYATRPAVTASTKKCRTVSTPSHADFFPCFFDLALRILQCLCRFFRFVSQIVHLPSRFLCGSRRTPEALLGILPLLFGLIGVVGSLFECCSGVVCDGLRLAQCFLCSF